MPAETERQDRVWMAFPPDGGYLGDTAGELDEARTAWREVAHSILRFEPVTMVVDPHDLAAARRYLSSEVELVIAPLDDAWMRDIGPTFVLGENGRLGAVTWRFNGWGAQDWARWGSDSVIGSLVAARAGVTRVPSDLVNEGGAIHVDGLGTVLLTETVQLDPGRNPERTKENVEAELARTIGTTNPIWLKRGLYRDAKRFGTRGHVDIVATIPSPGRMLVHSQQDASHPDHAITHGILDTLRASRTADGAEWDIVEVPAPQVLRDDEDFVDYSYINHLVVNGGVIACTFDDPNDEQALNMLAAAYDGREVVGVDARAIFERGGGIHCITQQQPRASAPTAG
ncbi:agmatine deiminase family protein [Humibacter antri]